MDWSVAGPGAGAGAFEGFVGLEGAGAAFLGAPPPPPSGASGSASSGFSAGGTNGLTLSAGLLNGTSSFFCGAPAVTNASFGFFAMATRMKSIHIGSAA